MQGTTNAARNRGAFQAGAVVVAIFTAIVVLIAATWLPQKTGARTPLHDAAWVATSSPTTVSPEICRGVIVGQNQANLSIVENPRLEAIASRPALATERSYWEYTLEPRVASDLPSGQACPPFFDTDPQTPLQPPAPSLDAFDRATLRACGDIRGRVNEAEFEALINDHFDRLTDGLPATWQSLPQARVVRELKQIWLTHKGFDHVFCGEWQGGSIGGLHARARYLQLQQTGAACLNLKVAAETDPGHIYTIGVSSRDGANTHPRKGYALNQSSLDLFLLATRAAARHCMGTTSGWQPYAAWYDKVFYLLSAHGRKTIANRVICKANDREQRRSRGLLTIYPVVNADEAIPVCSDAQGTCSTI